MLNPLPASLNHVDWPSIIHRNAVQALHEDLGDPPRDLTSELMPAERTATGQLLARESFRMAGQDWFEACFSLLSPHVRMAWHYKDGDEVPAGAVVLEATGPVRTLLTAERSAMNFLQTLSGTATRTARLAALIEDLPCSLLDTRKTLPGLRLAQKYAVVCGGGANHRLGLFDRFLIKENHIMACGGIREAVHAARKIADNLVEVEVENMAELEQACASGADIIMLDNFTPDEARAAVDWVSRHCDRKRPKLEASGNIDKHTLRAYAETGVDFISCGDLTKSVIAVDLSFRLNP
jgi:nicotinate-nucleotide pyrophosphorylase (carboxylating)